MAKAKKWFQRKGAVAVTLAFLLIPMLLFVALCVDIGWITKAKSELQNASDAAAAAGAAKLMDNYSASALPIQPNYNSIVTSAKNSASSYVMEYGRYNGAGNVNSLQILQGDIQYGFTDASGAYNANYTGYPNTVRVMGRLDPTANGSLPLFFGGITGRDKSALTAFSNATIYTGVINSFDPNNGAWGNDPNDSCNCNHPCLLLPVAFDINSWKQFFASGVSPDGVVHTDNTGAAQIQIYPCPQMAPYAVTPFSLQ